MSTSLLAGETKTGTAARIKWWPEDAGLVVVFALREPLHSDTRFRVAAFRHTAIYVRTDRVRDPATSRC